MGWNYPEEGRYAICEVCNKDASSTLDGCRCPECLVCHECGNPECSINGGIKCVPLVPDVPGHAKLNIK